MSDCVFRGGELEKRCWRFARVSFLPIEHTLALWDRQQIIIWGTFSQTRSSFFPQRASSFETTNHTIEKKRISSFVRQRKSHLLWPAKCRLFSCYEDKKCADKMRQKREIISLDPKWQFAVVVTQMNGINEKDGKVNKWTDLRVGTFQLSLEDKQIS